MKLKIICNKIVTITKISNYLEKFRQKNKKRKKTCFVAIATLKKQKNIYNIHVNIFKGGLQYEGNKKRWKSCRL